MSTTAKKKAQRCRIWTGECKALAEMKKKWILNRMLFILVFDLCDHVSQLSYMR